MLRRLRPYLIALVVAAAVVGAFVGVVGPLFMTQDTKRAEITGLFDQQLVAGRSGQISVAIDNTGDSQITPLCVSAQFSDASVSVTSVVFSNTDTQPFINGHACGGGLVGQETINVIFVVTVAKPGRINVTMTPLQASTPVGDPLHGHIDVGTG